MSAVIYALIVCHSFAVVDSVAAGRHFFVDQHHASASDENPGTEQMPWKTIRKAADTVEPGDTVIVKVGHYIELSDRADWSTAVLSPRNSGTRERPIRFVVFPGHRVTVSAVAHLPAIGQNDRDNILWEGFITDRPIAIFDSQGGEIGYCEIVGKMIPTKDNHDGIRVERSDNCRIRHCSIHGVRGDSWNSAGIKIYGQGHRGVVVEDNYIHGNTTGVFDKDTGVDNVYRRNFLTDNGFCFLGNNQGKEARYFIYDNVIDGHIELMIRNNGSKIHDNLFRSQRVAGSGEREPDTIRNLEMWNNVVVGAGDIVGYAQATPFTGRELAYCDHNFYVGRPTYELGKVHVGLDGFLRKGFESHSHQFSKAADVMDPRGVIVARWRQAGRYRDAPGPENIPLILQIARYGPGGRQQDAFPRATLSAARK